jgi:hypothetical protein
MGGLPDGELAKSASAVPKFYRARVFARHTVGFGGARDEVEAGPNQLAGALDQRRLVITVGNLSVKDLFDLNRYAGDPRSDFMNASIVTSGAYDYSADSHGYSWGAAAEWFDDGWALRAGRFMEPRESNGLPLDWAINRHHGDQVEIERDFAAAGRPGKARLTAFRNVATMGGFRDALALAAATGTVPDLRRVLSRRVKHGYIANVEQELADGVGLFAKASWNDGHSETYSYIEVDRSLSAGIALQGRRWGLDGHEAGAAFVRNGLSSAHRDYLAAGGHGFFIGDGALRYRPESIAEAYYQARAGRALSFTLDWQLARNPAYNADRGPVHVFSGRLHASF